MIDLLAILFFLTFIGIALLLLAFCKSASAAEERDAQWYNKTVCKEALYWDRINTLAAIQRQKGIRTYGKTIEQNRDTDTAARLTMLEEELVDSLMYLEWLRDALEQDTRGN